MSDGLVELGLVVLRDQGLTQADLQERRLGLQRDRLAIGRLRLLGAAGLEQDLALQLVQIGVVGKLGDQRVDRLDRLVRLRLFVVGDGPGITGGERLVAFLIIDKGLHWRVDEGLELGDHQFVPCDRLGRIDGAVVGVLLHPHPQRLDPVGSQRVALEERILLGVREDFLVTEVVEEIDEPPAGLARLFEVGGGGLVGVGFLNPGVAKVVQSREVAGAVHQRGAGVGRAGGGGQDAQSHGQQEGFHRLALALAGASEVAASHVPGLVGDDTDQLIGRLGLHDQAGEDEHLLAARDEGVQVVGAHDVELHRLRIDAGGDEDRIGVLMQDLLDLGVTDEGAVGQILLSPRCGRVERHRRQPGGRAGA